MYFPCVYVDPGQTLVKLITSLADLLKLVHILVSRFLYSEI